MRALAALVLLTLLPLGCQSADAPMSDAAYESVESAAMAAAPEPSARAAGGDASAPIPVDGDAPALGRELVKTGTVVLRADDHAEAVERARGWTRVLGGMVTDEDSRRTDTRVETALTLRVPAARFDTLMTVLSALPGTLESRAVGVDDVTRPVADTEARLRVRRAAEERLLALLDDAESVPDVLAVQARLDAVREEIESAEAVLRTLRADVSQSTVNLTVYEASAAGLAPGPGFFSRAGRAMAGGWNGLLETLIAIAALWPLWLVVAGGIWLARWARRRRRLRREARETTPAALPPGSPRASTWS